MPSIQELPLELVLAIYDYLAPMLPPTVRKSKTHPFVAASLASRTLRNALYPYLCLHIRNSNLRSLSIWKAIVSDPQNSTALSGDVSRDTSKLLKVWLIATMEGCFCCGKISTRRAIMDSTLVCCPKCDKSNWPEKITMTEAMRKYGLRKEELFGGVLPSTLGGPPEVTMTKDGIIPKRLGLPYAHLISTNSITTMFMEDDVRQLALKKHGIDDIQKFLASRSYKSEARRAKIDLAKFKRRNYINRLAQENGLNLAGSQKRVSYYQIERRVCNPLALLRGDLLFKKLGITFVDFFPTESVPRAEMAPSSSKLFEFLQTFMPENGFLRDSKTWPYTDLLGCWFDECRFRRIGYIVATGIPGWSWEYSNSYKVNLNTLTGEHPKTEKWFKDVEDANNNWREVELANWELQGNASGEKPFFGIFDGEVKDSPIKVHSARYPNEFEQMIFLRMPITPQRYENIDMKVERTYGVVIEYADPVDYCLFERFIEEFSPKGVPPPTMSYAQLRDIWLERGPEKGQERVPVQVRPLNAPWSFLRYPVYIHNVTEDDYTSSIAPRPLYTHHPSIHYETPQGELLYGPCLWYYRELHTASARTYVHTARAEYERIPQEEKVKIQDEWIVKRQKEQEKMAAINSLTMNKFKKMEAAIMAVVRQYGWDLLGQDRGDAWERAVEEEINGKGKGAAKGKNKGKGKGKG